MSRISKKYPPVTSLIVNKLGYNGMATWGDDIIKGEYIG